MKRHFYFCVPAVLFLGASAAQALPSYVDAIPGGNTVGCVLCHQTAEGGDKCIDPTCSGNGCPGEPCFNPFGEAYCNMADAPPGQR